MGRGVRHFAVFAYAYCLNDVISIVVCEGEEGVQFSNFFACVLNGNRPFALTSQILRVSSRCSLTISVRVQQPHTAQELTILIQNYYKFLQNLLCLQKLYYA
jgi:hypothetical protein